jgi:hypothetical protein|tara:strand:+ start:1996 stop:2310 length:315 start_codon:yes stop_codon:yes gene_type:complete
MLVGVLTAQNPHNDGSQLPQPKIPFELTYYDIKEQIHDEYEGGKVLVEFWIDEEGKVLNPVIIDTFNVNFNSIIIDKVKQQKYYPALQNGKPVKVKYSLPIVFK